MKGNYYIAKVMNNTGTTKVPPDPLNGWVQIYIEHLMHGLKPLEYPWARADREMTSDVPEKDDFVWVWFEDEEFWRNPFYGNKVDTTMVNGHKDFTLKVQTDALMGSTAGYPYVKYNMYKNGICIGASSDPACKEIFMYHSPGTFIFISSIGKIKISTTQNIEIGTQGSVFEKMLMGESFQSWFNSHIHPTPAGPSSPPTLPSLPTHLSHNVKVGL